MVVPVPKKITAAYLRRHRACSAQVKAFINTWPDGVVPSAKAARQAAKAGLSPEWFISVLYRQYYAQYYAAADKLLDAYIEEIDRADALYPNLDANRVERDRVNRRFDTKNWLLVWKLIKDDQ